MVGFRMRSSGKTQTGYLNLQNWSEDCVKKLHLNYFFFSHSSTAARMALRTSSSGTSFTPRYFSPSTVTVTPWSGASVRLIPLGASSVPSNWACKMSLICVAMLLNVGGGCGAGLSIPPTKSGKSVLTGLISESGSKVKGGTNSGAGSADAISMGVRRNSGNMESTGTGGNSGRESSVGGVTDSSAEAGVRRNSGNKESEGAGVEFWQKSFGWWGN